MEEYNIIIIKEHNKLKCFLYNHFFLFSIDTILNILLFIKMYFLYKVYIAFYLISTIIYFVLILVPIYPLILFKKRLFPKKAKFLKKLTFIIIFIILFFALLINLIICLNIYGLFSFYKECPYNFSYNDIARIFDINYNEDKNKYIHYTYSEKCSDNRCILIGEKLENINYDEYLCNFDSSEDFQSFDKKITKTLFFVNNNNNTNSINCKIFDEKEFDNIELYQNINNENMFIIESYYDICSSQQTFYKCYRNEKPKSYNIDYDFSCPNINNNITSIIIWIISFIFNLVLSLIIIIFEFLRYKKIIKLYHDVHINREGASTNHTTRNPSKNTSINHETNNERERNSHTIIIDGDINRNVEDLVRSCNNVNKLNNEEILPEINNEQVLNLNIKYKNDIHENLQTNEIEISDRCKINLMTITGTNIRNETGDHITVNNSIEFKQIDFIEPNDDNKKNNKNDIYIVK